MSSFLMWMEETDIFFNTKNYIDRILVAQVTESTRNLVIKSWWKRRRRGEPSWRSMLTIRRHSVTIRLLVWLMFSSPISPISSRFKLSMLSGVLLRRDRMLWWRVPLELARLCVFWWGHYQVWSRQIQGERYSTWLERILRSARWLANSRRQPTPVIWILWLRGSSFA